jgi:hypothetical protein
MKKIVLLFAVLFTAGSIKAQTCSSHAITYSGPHNSNQVERILNESTNPVLVNLDPGIKSSIVTYLEFNQGMPVGFSGTDASLKKLLATPEYASAVMSAILKLEVIATTFDKKPVTTEISMEEFLQLLHTNGGAAPATKGSMCLNCNAPDSNVYKCCEVAENPRGCIDFFVVIKDINYKVK